MTNKVILKVPDIARYTNEMDNLALEFQMMYDLPKITKEIGVSWCRLKKIGDFHLKQLLIFKEDSGYPFTDFNAIAMCIVNMFKTSVSVNAWVKIPADIFTKSNWNINLFFKVITKFEVNNLIEFRDGMDSSSYFRFRIDKLYACRLNSNGFFLSPLKGDKLRSLLNNKKEIFEIMDKKLYSIVKDKILETSNRAA